MKKEVWGSSGKGIEGHVLLFFYTITPLSLFIPSNYTVTPRYPFKL
jgi:hypothetical protein